MLTRELIANVRRIEIRTRRAVDDLVAGAYHSVFKGRGIEFLDVREYQPEDDIRDIDWNVTARFGHPFVKTFVEERELTVLLLVDLSASGDFGSTGRSKTQCAAELAALLGFSALRNNDRVGLLTFTDRSEHYLHPRKGRRHVLRLVRDLLAAERDGTGTDIGAALKNASHLLKRRSVVFLITDLIDEGFSTAMSMLTRKHDLIVIRVSDPHEQRLPATSHITMEDAETGSIVHVPGHRSDVLNAYAARATREAQRRQQLVIGTGADLVDVTCGSNIVGPIMALFRRREKRR